MLRATISKPADGKYGVKFYMTQGSEGPLDHTLPSFYVPCYSYEHAAAVTNAFNAGHIQPQPVNARPLPPEVRMIGELVEEGIEQARREGRHYAEPR